MTALEVVSVNYFGAEVLDGLVSSLKRQDEQDWRLVVVDNSESEAEAARLRRLAEGDARLVVAVTPENLGYFGAADWWLQEHPSSAEWVAVCNVDLELANVDFVSTLMALDAAASVLAPDITALPSRRAQNPFMHNRPSATGMLLRRFAFSTPLSAWGAKKLSSYRASQQTEVREPAQLIYAPHGAFILFHRSFFEAGGSLQHPPFLYGEEITVAERARALGLSVRYEPVLRIVHNEHQATGKVSKRIFRAQREAAVYAHRLISRRETVGRGRSGSDKASVHDTGTIK